MAADEPHPIDELWRELSPELRQALIAIYARAHGPYRVRLQSIVNIYIAVFDAAVRAGATQSMLAHWLSQAGLCGRDGRPVQLGSLSRAISRARRIANRGAPSPTLPAETEQRPGRKPNGATRPAIERGSAQLPIPPPHPPTPSMSASVASALEAGRLLNRLREARK